MPLRGKILNTWELESGVDRLLRGSARHQRRPGGRSGLGRHLTQLRYHKVCILADADSDGLHIATLLCALFLRHFRPAGHQRHVYVAMPPLYRIDAGKQVYYALDDAERDQLIARIAEGELAHQAHRHPLQGPGRDESDAAARDHHRSADPAAGAADRGRRPTTPIS